MMLKRMSLGVGEGKKIKIMSDNWIPGLSPSYFFSTLEVLPGNAPVSFLMNSKGNAWDMDTVRTFFVEDMAQIIHRIPISRHGREEFASGHMHGLAFILSALPTTSQGLSPSTHLGVPCTIKRVEVSLVDSMSC
jgi:hypothetical protein